MLVSLSFPPVCDLSNLKNSLMDDPVARPRPLSKSERTQQILPVEVNPLQEDLLILGSYTHKKQLRIKEKKKEVKFHFSNNCDFPQK